MRFVKGLLIAAALAAGCQSPPPRVPARSLIEAVRTLCPGSAHYFIAALNPNDCVNCRVGFRMLFAQLQRQPENRAACLLVLPRVRVAERREIFRTTLRGIDTAQVKLLWDDEQYRELQLRCNVHDNASVLYACDAKGKPFFTARVQEVTGLENALRPFLE